MEQFLDLLNVPKNSLIRFDIACDINSFEAYRLIQIGGSKSVKKNPRVEIKYKNMDFNFHQITDEYGDKYSLFKNDNDKEMPECIVIIIDKKERTAYLNGMSSDSSCCINPNQLCTGSTLLKLAIKFVKFIKEKYKLRYFQLKDNSYKICNGKQIHLALFYGLLNGDTWYGKHRFLPFNTKDENIDNNLMKRYKNNKKIIKNIKIKDIKNLKKYLIKSYQKIKPKIKLYDVLKMYEKHYDNLLSNFLRDYLFNFDQTCDMFYLFVEDLARDIGFYNFHSKTFVYYL